MNILLFLVMCASLALIPIGAASAQVMEYPYPDSITRSSLTVDNDGQLWGINTWLLRKGGPATGVGKFVNDKWKNYRTESGLSNDTLSSAVCDKTGRVWVAGKKVVAYYDARADHWINIAIKDEFTSVRDYQQMVVDSQNNLWVSSFPKVVASYIGSTPLYKSIFQLHKWDGSSWQTYDLREALLGHPDPSGVGADIRIMAVAPDGTIWYIGGPVFAGDHYNFGLYHFDNGKLEGFNLAGLSEFKNTPDAMGLVVDHSGKVWVGYRDFWAAYDIFDPKTGTWIEDSSRARVKSANLFNTPSSVGIGPDGNIWMMGYWPRENGEISIVVIINPDTRAIISEIPRAALPLALTSVAFDPAGGAWFSGNTALAHYNFPAKVHGVKPEISRCYPNPAPLGSKVTLVCRLMPRVVQVYSSLGLTVTPALLLSDRQVEVPTEHLASGSYTARVSYDGETELFQFTVIK